MAHINIHYLCSLWHDKVIFEDVGFLVTSGDRVTLADENDGAKTILLNTIHSTCPLKNNDFLIPANTWRSFWNQEKTILNLSLNVQHKLILVEKIS